MKVPSELDGAKVILYTSNDVNNNFGYVHFEDDNINIVITGMAIAKYDNSERYYLFSCDLEWNVISDTLHETLEEAIYCAENSYETKGFDWYKP